MHHLLTQADKSDLRRLAGMFVAVRHERRINLPREIILAEGEEEFNEGTATYVQTRLYELLARNGGISPSTTITDPHFNGFIDAFDDYEMMIARIQPPDNTIVTFFHAMYNLGMAQCLVLDRLSHDWKVQLAQKGSSVFDILAETLSLDPDEMKKLSAEAKKEFGYKTILALQSQLVSDRVAELCGFIEAPGRHYRIYFSTLQQPFKWKPRGPVYQVPNSLMKEIDERSAIETIDLGWTATSNKGPTIWGGGFASFEIGEMIFESQEVPILMRMDYFEWIDTDPAEDESDLTIESSRMDGNIYYDLVMQTDGFVLKVPLARIERADGVVAIIPIVDEP
jgi:hypothetical protein